MDIYSLSCCGVRELCNLSSHRNGSYLKALVKLIYYDYDWKEDGNTPSYRYIIYTQAGVKSRYGDKLTREIERNNLGSVISTTRNVNPNSGNKLKVFVWTMDFDALRSYAQANNIIRRY